MQDIISIMRTEIVNIDLYIAKVINDEPDFFVFSKWGKYLPNDLKKASIIDSFFDIPGTTDFLNNVEIIMASI